MALTDFAVIFRVRIMSLTPSGRSALAKKIKDSGKRA